MRSASSGLLGLSGLSLALFLACGGDNGAEDPSDGSGGNAGETSTGGTGAGTGSGGTSQDTGGSNTGGTSQDTGGTSQGTGGAANGQGGELRGAASLHILSPAGCSLAEHFHDFPQLPAGRPVTEAAKVQGVVDGGTTPDGDPAIVVCNWRPVSGVVLVSGVLRLGPAGSQRFVSLGAIMVPGETDESRGITLGGPDLPHQYGGSCEYTAFEVDHETRSVWGTVSCDELSSLDDTDVCALGPSYFFFENCNLED